MKDILILLIGLFVFAGCKEAEEPSPEPLTLEEQVREVMNMPLDTKTGKLVRSVTYGGDSDRIHATREIYYVSGADIEYHVVRDQFEDTVMISLNYYEGEKIQLVHKFNFSEERGPEWQSSWEYEYSLDGRLLELYVTTVNKLRALLAYYRYDGNDRLIAIETPNEIGAELMVYDYNQQGTIHSEWKTAKGQEEHKIDYMVYRYQEGKLVAKEAGERGSLEGPRRDQFRYVYDQQGRLALQYEFDPYFGFQQMSRTEFFYE